jgi:squalene-hopene/tetraprenyl-beta-curcumene cyclase
LAYRDLGQIAGEPAQRGLRWLATHADSGGGWGGSLGGSAETAVGQSSVEETALAVQALLAAVGDPAVRPVLDEGIQWLIQAVGESRHRKAAPIGLYFAKLGYYEKVFPLAFAVAALGQAVRQLSAAPSPEAADETAD